MADRAAGPVLSGRAPYRKDPLVEGDEVEQTVPLASLSARPRPLPGAEGEILEQGVVTPARAAGFAVGVAVATVTAIAGSGAPVHASDVAAVVVAAMSAAAWGLAARHRTGRTLIALGLLAAGSVAWAAGRLVGSAQGAVQGRVTTAVSGDDVGRLVAGACLLAAVVLLAEGPGRRLTQVRAVIEGATIAACLLFASWGEVVGPSLDAAAERGGLAGGVLAAQPLLAIAIASLLVSASTRVPPRRWDWWVPVAIGIGLLVVADVVTGHGDALVLGHGSGLGAILHLAGFGLLLVAAVTSTAPERSTPRPMRGRPILTWLPSVAALGVLVGLAVRGGDLDATRMNLAMLVVCLSVSLHLVVILESDDLSADLSAAHDEAIAASESKSRFLATVSHEIRTPMNAVIGLTGLLLDSDLDEDQQELAAGVAISAEGLLELINDLLDFSKIEADRLELEEIDLDLEDLIGEVATIVAEGAHRKGLEVIAYCEPGLPPERRGDPLRLRQILLNLASNAVKFTDKGTVVVRARPIEGHPDQVAFEVIDTGIGIPSDARSRLFEPFSQADGSTTRTHGGTGLGLAIVKNLVDRQGGTVAVESEVGRGTCFRVTLPLPQGRQHRVEAGLESLVGLRALVVDGNAVTRTVLAHTLHTWGFVVDQAVSAEDALEMYADTDAGYAIALIEFHLDGMDGVRLGEVLRAQEPERAPVVFLLSSDPEVSRRSAREAGVRSVLVKPVRNSYLLRRLVDTLVAEPLGRSPSLPPTATTPAAVPAGAVPAKGPS